MWKYVTKKLYPALSYTLGHNSLSIYDIIIQALAKEDTLHKPQSSISE